MKRKNGISIYPDKNSLNDQIEYIKLAAKYGYEYVFATMHMPELSIKDQLEFISNISNTVHKNEMKIVVDIRGSFIEKIYKDQDLKQKFKSLKLDALRIDFEMEASLLEMIRDLNVLEVFINSSTVSYEFTEKYKNLCETIGLTLKGCHNFYPRPETGLGPIKYLRQEAIFSKLGIENWTFVPNLNNPRGPIYKGLPTLEDHRNMSTLEAGLDLKINYGTQNILIGDGMADENSLRDLQDAKIEKEIELRIKVINRELTEKLLKKAHPVRVDSGKFQIRLDGIRQMASHSGLDIKAENIVERNIGAITVDNNFYKRYEGETQIIIEKLEADEKVNVIAQVIEQDLWLLKFINSENFIRFKVVDN